MNQPWVYMCSPVLKSPSYLPPHPIPLGCPSALVSSALFHALNLDWSSIYHRVIYMFQRHSPKSSHSRLLSQSPKDCSVHLCLFCYLTYRVIVTIFLNSIYVLVYCLGREGNSSPFQCSCLENPMDRGAW